jgi:hypothetical protein
MKRILLAASATLVFSGFAATASAVPVTGTVNVIGHVDSSCTVTTGGSGQTFTTATFGGAGVQLDDGTGHLNTAWGSQPFATGAALGNFEVTCNNANPTITLAATPMNTAGSPATGYANIVHYNAYADFLTITGVTPATVHVPTGNAGLATTDALAGATTGGVGLGAGVFFQNVANNVVIRADSFGTNGGNGNVLIPGTYTGVITLTITPT